MSVGAFCLLLSSLFFSSRETSMPLVRQKMIYRVDLQGNPECRYVFGDNFFREGLGGQAGQMRGEPNAIGIPTKHYPSMHPSAFFKDGDFDEITSRLERDFALVEAALKEGRTVVFHGIGTGLSELPKRAPRISVWIDEKIVDLEKRFS